MKYYHAVRLCTGIIADLNESTLGEVGVLMCKNKRGTTYHAPAFCSFLGGITLIKLNRVLCTEL